MPFPDENDDWAELARELARDKPKPVESTLNENDCSAHPMELEVSASELDGGTLGEETSRTGGAVNAADEQGDPGRKRRRRRRRRRRSGSEESADAPGAGSEHENEAPEGDPAEGGFEGSEVGFADEVEVESDTEVLSDDSDVDEDAGEELLRELIANWNVPSWDDVVGGLYRPER